MVILSQPQCVKSLPWLNYPKPMFQIVEHNFDDSVGNGHNKVGMEKRIIYRI